MLVFLLAVACITGAVKAAINMEVKSIDLSAINEENYYESQAFANESYGIIAPLKDLITHYKSEEYILSGKALTADDLQYMEEEFSYSFAPYEQDPNLSEAESNRIYQEKYAAYLKREKEKRINEQVKMYHQLLADLKSKKGILYYGSNGEQEFANSEFKTKAQFETYKAHMLFVDYEQMLHPVEMKNSRMLDNLSYVVEEMNPQTDVIYVAFEPAFLQQKMQEWQANKAVAKDLLNEFIVFLAGFIITFIYLVIVIGRTSFNDKEVHLHVIDKLYNDLNVIIAVSLPTWWIFMLVEVFQDAYLFLTIPIFSIALLLILSLVKHCKNRTILSHTLIYQLLKKVFLALKSVFDSGSIGVKTVLVVIGYPALVAATFFMFPVTIAVVAWLALKKAKSFKRMKEGVEQIKNGDLQHHIEVEGKGELSQLANSINQITEGLRKSVDSEIKSERLKTELITNVSHDIRTPLTSIITYVDLLKTETDPEKIAEYIDVLDQKSERLKHLTDDLFEAAKASSGSMPVQLEKIDIVSLLTQGIGEMDEQIEASALDFKLAYPTEKVYMKADGKLLWRGIENLFSNIFKYAQPASRVYIDVQDLGNEISVTFKNISAFELNISADELMERFTRGDESRTSQGSGLGLSIAESLINIQRGKFKVQVDGDLFKAIIVLPKFPTE